MGAYEKLGMKMDESKKTVNEVMGISEKEAIDIIKEVDYVMAKNDLVTKMMKELLEEYDGAKAVFAVYSLGVKIGAKRAIMNIIMAATKEEAML